MIVHHSGTGMIISAQCLKIHTKVTTIISTIFADNGIEEETLGVISKHTMVVKMALPLTMES